MSSGNNTTVFNTGDNPYILVVSATDSGDNIASFSNTGTNVDISAPGVSIYTTNNGGGYGYWSGTSFSAPITAGVAALMIAANPALTAQQVSDRMKQAVDDRGAAGYDPTFGWGRVNAAKAVSLATGGAPPPADTTAPTVSITSPANGATVSGTVPVQVSASDASAVASITLMADGTSLGTVSVSSYTFSWNTLGWANGTHTLTASAVDTAGNQGSTQISVTVNNVADTTAPSVAITTPGNGVTVSRNVSVGVSATDNVAVVRVELYVDGVLTASSTTAPFGTAWNPRKAAAGAHTLQCKAYDAAGNVGASQAVTVYK